MTEGKKLYMIVSRDKYELPEVVTESLREMARYTGRSLDSMHTCFSKGRHPERGGQYKYFRRYVTVEVEDDEDYGLENIALIDKKRRKNNTRIISNNILKHLDLNGLGLSDLAQMTGVNRSSIQQYTSGKQTANVITLFKMAKALNCTIEDFLEGIDITNNE